MLIEIHPDDFADYLSIPRHILAVCLHGTLNKHSYLEPVRTAILPFIDRLVTLVVDAAESNIFTKKYKIDGTPTYILFYGQDEVSRIEGKRDAEFITDFLRSNLKKRTSSEKGDR